MSGSGKHSSLLEKINYNCKCFTAQDPLANVSTFFYLSLKAGKKARLFIQGRFNPPKWSTILLSSFPDIIVPSKTYQGKNTLAYFAQPSTMKGKCLTRLFQ
jgi:hypothetical protein